MSAANSGVFAFLGNTTNVTIGISEFQVTTDPDATLVTYSLGSCLGIVLWDEERKIAGMAHCLLPLSRTDPEKAKANPAMFTDTGVIALLSAMAEQGATVDKLVVKIAGGGSPLGNLSSYDIGDRNVTVLRKILWKNSLLIAAEDVGGSKPRTLRLHNGTGEVTVSTGREITEL